MNPLEFVAWGLGLVLLILLIGQYSDWRDR